MPDLRQSLRNQLINNQCLVLAPGTPCPLRFTPLQGKQGIELAKHGKFCAPLTQNLPQMATYSKRGNRVRVQICCKGVRKSKTFPSMGAARVWGTQTESAILAGDRGEIPDKLFSDLLDRYVNEVSPHKKGERWESVRIEAVKRDRIAQVRLKDLGSHHVSDWRDRRLKDVSGATVLREKTLLRHACQIAIDEWKWLKVNPFHKVRMPKDSKPRTRLMSEDERSKLIEQATTPVQKEVIRIMEFALETGMRASEICGLETVSGNVAVLHDTKNGESRQVPLSQKALELWGNKPFTLTPAQLDANWRKLTKAAGIVDLHFHDTRASAATRLCKILNPLQLAKMFGWKDLKMAMVYYRESAEDVAKLL